MSVDFFSLIHSVEAYNGEVLITLRENNVTRANSMTVDEALDRAEAIGHLRLENIISHRQVKELYDMLMGAAAEARSQQEIMRRNGEFVDFRMKEVNKRRLEIHKANRKTIV